jgi:hypothetical protein
MGSVHPSKYYYLLLIPIKVSQKVDFLRKAETTYECNDLHAGRYIGTHSSRRFA